MKFSDLEKSALHLNELYEQLEIKRYGRAWSTTELALVLANKCGVDLEAEFARNTRELAGYVSDELGSKPRPA